MAGKGCMGYGPGPVFEGKGAWGGPYQPLPQHQQNGPELTQNPGAGTQQLLPPARIDTIDYTQPPPAIPKPTGPPRPIPMALPPFPEEPPAQMGTDNPPADLGRRLVAYPAHAPPPSSSVARSCHDGPAPRQAACGRHRRGRPWAAPREACP